MTTAPPVQVRVVRRFHATPERVFDAWLDPVSIAKWMFGPALREEEVLQISVDPRVGGAFSFRVRRQGQEIDHIGEYLTLERPRRLAFTWGIAGVSDDESRVTIEITPIEGECELTLTHALDAKWIEYAARAESAWTKMLEVLAGSLETR